MDRMDWSFLSKQPLLHIPAKHVRLEQHLVRILHFLYDLFSFSSTVAFREPALQAERVCRFFHVLASGHFDSVEPTCTAFGGDLSPPGGR